MRDFLLRSLLLGLGLGATLHAAEPTPQQAAFFQSKVAPILSERCYKCHAASEGKTKGGLALDSRDAMLKGGDDGQILTADNLGASEFSKRLLSHDPEEKMPPKADNLGTAEMAVFSEWLKMGAPIPASHGSDDGKKGAIAVKDTSAGKKHWAWQPLKSIAPPAVASTTWVKTPVDNFIAAKQEQQKMTPGEAADRPTLIRRAYFDLVGLPPMPWEVQAFVDDKAPNAWEKVIDKLLASPHYGERWGRFWLDVARYSDTKGQSKKDSPLYVDAWTYRDYVIDAFNKDKPYDRFILEQIAADKLNLGADKRPLAGLGFLTLGDRFMGNKNDVINDRIDVVSKGFLGLTVACARCHDHMFDPIPQKDYYSLHGIFASSAEPKDNPIIAAQSDAKLYQEYLKAREEAGKASLNFAAGEYERARQLFRKHAGDLLMLSKTQGQDRSKYIKAVGLPAKQADEFAQFIRKGNQGVARFNPVVAPFFAFAQLAEKGFAEKAAPLAQVIASGGNKRLPVNPMVAAAFKGKSPDSMDEVVGIYNGLFQNLEKSAPAARPESTKLAGGITKPAAVNEDLQAMLNAPFMNDPMKDFDPDLATTLLPQKVAQRFTSLQSAVTQVELTHPGAPKRAMVMEDVAKPMNSSVFIRGEANNKGEIAPRRFLEILSPVNRPEFKEGSGRLELAECIASKSNPLTPRVMMNRIWLHHFGEGIVTTPDDFGTMSAPPSHPELLDYLASRFVQSGWSVKAMHKLIMLSATYQQKGETNDTYAKADPENRLLWHYAMRRLDFEPLRDSLLYIAGQLDLKVGGQPVNILSEPYSMRRSVYGYIDRRELPEMMNHFDFANPAEETGKRHETTVPQQALFMMNSPLMVDVSRKLLARPEMSLAKNDSQRIHALYWMIFQRPPRPEEIELGLEYVKEIEQPPTDAAQLAEADVAATPATEAAASKVPVGRRLGGKAMRQATAAEREKIIAARKAANQAAGKKRYGGVNLVNPGERVDRRALSPWENYTHALLMANEMVYFN